MLLLFATHRQELMLARGESALILPIGAGAFIPQGLRSRDQRPTIFKDRSSTNSEDKGKNYKKPLMHDRVFGPNFIFTRNKTPVLYQGTIRNKCSPRTCSAPHPVAAIYHAESLFAKPLFTTERYMWKKKIQPNCEKYIADYIVSLFFICFDIFGKQFD